MKQRLEYIERTIHVFAQNWNEPVCWYYHDRAKGEPMFTLGVRVEAGWTGWQQQEARGYMRWCVNYIASGRADRAE